MTLRLPATTVRRLGPPLALGALALVALRSRTVASSLGHLSRPSPGWLALALLAELASLLAYVLVVRRLLVLRGVAAPVGTLFRATVGGVALGASLPGGQAASAVYWYRQLRREGADGRVSAFALAGAAVAGGLSLAALVGAGLVLAGGHGPLAAVRVPVAAAIGAVLVVAPWVLRGRVPLRTAVEVAALALVNWLLDCGTLAASLAATHAQVPLHGLLLTFALAQVVASIPLLPGGGGTVEATLTLGFAAFGGSAGGVVAGVLLFRLIACWGLVPVGWAAIALDGRALSWRWASARPVRAIS